MSQWRGMRRNSRSDAPTSRFWPKGAAQAVFSPAWVPEPVDPLVEELKRYRVIAGLITALGLYTFVAGDFSFDELLENVATACGVLLLMTPLTVGVLLFVWRRSGPLRELKGPLLGSLRLLLLFVGSAILIPTVLTSQASYGGLGLGTLVAVSGLWLVAFVVRAAIQVNRNFFGTAAVHRCLPPLLAMVTSWLMALSDLVGGELHGMGRTLGVVFILGAPVAVTGIALFEMRRLKVRYGIRLGTHPHRRG